MQKEIYPGQITDDLMRDVRIGLTVGFEGCEMDAKVKAMDTTTPSLASSAHKKGVVVLSVGAVSVASFPAWLNQGKMPALDDVTRLCGLTPEGSETVKMTGDQLAGLLETVPASGLINAQAETVCVSVRNKRNGVTAFPLVARLLSAGDVWSVTAPRGMLTRTEMADDRARIVREIEKEARKPWADPAYTEALEKQIAFIDNN